ncbi:MAG: hypothetical protein D6677_02650 [Calditrichaeota bacterium]|nr:MAG: hypothetical protein D6677_02650 [Calditrichota bacterium]
MFKRILPAALFLTLAGLAVIFIFPERDEHLLTPLAFGGILIPLAFMTRHAAFKNIATHGAALISLLGFVFNVEALSVLWEGAANNTETHVALMRALTALVLFTLLTGIVFGLRAERLKKEAQEAKGHVD